MKKSPFILSLCSIMGACSALTAPSGEQRVLLSFDRIASQITVSRVDLSAESQPVQAALNETSTDN